MSAMFCQKVLLSWKGFGSLTTLCQGWVTLNLLITRSQRRLTTRPDDRDERSTEQHLLMLTGLDEELVLHHLDHRCIKCENMWKLFNNKTDKTRIVRTEVPVSSAALSGGHSSYRNIRSWHVNGTLFPRDAPCHRGMENRTLPCGRPGNLRSQGYCP